METHTVPRTCWFHAVYAQPSLKIGSFTARRAAVAVRSGHEAYTDTWRQVETTQFKKRKLLKHNLYRCKHLF